MSQEDDDYIETLERRLAECQAAEQQVAALKEAIKNQGEPVGWMDEFGNVFPLGANKDAGSWIDAHKRNWIPLYTSAPTIPEGWQLVPKEMTDAMEDAVGFMTPKEYAAMLSAAQSSTNCVL